MTLGGYDVKRHGWNSESECSYITVYGREDRRKRRRRDVHQGMKLSWIKVGRLFFPLSARKVKQPVDEKGARARINVSTHAILYT